MKKNYKKANRKIRIKVVKIFINYLLRSPKWQHKQQSMFNIFIFSEINHKKIHKFLVRNFLKSYKTYNMFADKRQIFLKKF